MRVKKATAADWLTPCPGPGPAAAATEAASRSVGVSGVRPVPPLLPPLPPPSPSGAAMEAGAGRGGRPPPPASLPRCWCSSWARLWLWGAASKAGPAASCTACCVSIGGLAAIGAASASGPLPPLPLLVCRSMEAMAWPLPLPRSCGWESGLVGAGWACPADVAPAADLAPASACARSMLFISFCRPLIS